MKLKNIILAVLCLCSILPVLVVGWLCSTRFSRQMTQVVEQNVETTARTQAQHLEDFLSKHRATMQTSAAMSSLQTVLKAYNRGLTDTEAYQTTLRSINSNFISRTRTQEELERSTLVAKDGAIIASSLEEIMGTTTILPEPYLNQVKQGQFVITDLLELEGYHEGIPHFCMVCPVYVDGAYEGFLLHVMNLDYFEQMVKDTTYFSSSALLVLDPQGKFVASSTGVLANSIEELNNMGTLTSQWRDLDFAKQTQGLLYFDLADQGKIGSYVVLPQIGWSVISMVDRSEFEIPVRQNLMQTVLFVLAVLCFVTLCYFLLKRYLAKPLDDLLKAIRQMQAGDYSHRFSYDRRNELGEIGNAFNDLMDKVERDNQELRLSEQRYRVVTEQSDSIIFEFNLEQGTMYHSSNWFRKFGYPPISSGFEQEMLRRKIVYPEDEERFIAFFERLKNGESYANTELRIKKADGSYLWCRMRGTAILSESGKPIKIIGKLTDIDSQKREKETLINRAQRDLLTGLYNKATTEAMIEQVLQEEGDQEHALFVIDVDNFKAINDQLGHLFGDAVLSDMATRISKLFRSTDIVGRIGGDEFVVFLRGGAKNPAMLEQKAQALSEAFRRTFVIQEMDYKVSGSIGAALAPQDGGTYKELFTCADTALYSAKKKGKDCYQFYSANLIEEHYLTEAEGRIQQEEGDQRPFKENVSEYIFQILYESKDVNTAVQLILDIVGRYYNVSRVYIFESSEDDLTCNNTFEWCNTGITPEIERLQNLSYQDDLEDYQKNFNEEGIFYCEDISTLPPNIHRILREQGIHSLLQCAIMEDDKFKGYVGFDECSEQRLWTKDEIQTLTFISKILSTFLLRMRTQDKLTQSNAITQTVLDNQDTWTYVIDQQNFELLFINQKTRRLIPGAEVGKQCYREFMGKEAPCSFCPMLEAEKGGGACTKEIYNPGLELWTKTTATRLHWMDGRLVYLISCADITAYKRRIDELENQKRAP